MLRPKLAAFSACSFYFCFSCAKKACSSLLASNRPKSSNVTSLYVPLEWHCTRKWSWRPKFWLLCCSLLPNRIPTDRWEPPATAPWTICAVASSTICTTSCSTARRSPPRMFRINAKVNITRISSHLVPWSLKELIRRLWPNFFFGRPCGKASRMRGSYEWAADRSLSLRRFSFLQTATRKKGLPATFYTPATIDGRGFFRPLLAPSQSPSLLFVRRIQLSTVLRSSPLFLLARTTQPPPDDAWRTRINKRTRWRHIPSLRFSVSLSLFLFLFFFFLLFPFLRKPWGLRI